MDLLRMVFSYICGQQHNWMLGEVTLPFCQRCTGLYVGAFCALMLIAAFRPRPSAFLYWLHGLFMLVMVPFGFHLVPHGGLIRTFTGALFAFGLVYYLALNPVSVWLGWKENRGLRIVEYLSLVAAIIVFLLIAVRWGGGITAMVLTSVGTLGLFGLVSLTAANLVVLPGILRVLLHRSVPSPQ